MHVQLPSPVPCGAAAASAHGTRWCQALRPCFRGCRRSPRRAANRQHRQPAAVPCYACCARCAGKSMAMIFTKPSMRTRVSFETVRGRGCPAVLVYASWMPAAGCVGRQRRCRWRCDAAHAPSAFCWGAGLRPLSLAAPLAADPGLAADLLPSHATTRFPPPPHTHRASSSWAATPSTWAPTTSSWASAS